MSFEWSLEISLNVIQKSSEVWLQISLYIKFDMSLEMSFNLPILNAI